MSLRELNLISDSAFQNITASTNVAGYNIPSLAYFQAAVPYTIVPSYGGQPLTSSNSGSSFSSLVSELVAGTQCQNGQLYQKNGSSSIPGFPTCKFFLSHAYFRYRLHLTCIVPPVPIKRDSVNKYMPVTKEFMHDLFARHGFVGFV